MESCGHQHNQHGQGVYRVEVLTASHGTFPKIPNLSVLLDRQILPLEYLNYMQTASYGGGRSQVVDGNLNRTSTQTFE